MRLPIATSPPFNANGAALANDPVTAMTAVKADSYNSQFPFIAFTAFILYSKEITQAEYDERKQTWDDGEDALEVLEQARRMDVAGIRE